jgi:predicted nucleotidyltransferase
MSAAEGSTIPCTSDQGVILMEAEHDQLLRAFSRLGTDAASVRSLCSRWGIREFSFFGSVLSDQFGPSSDVDVLITFDPGQAPGLIRFGQMCDELSRLFGRRVDVATRAAIERSDNAARRDAILGSARTVHAA